VLDKSDKPIANAVVYLKNTKTLAMKSYISQTAGTYRFPELSLNVDYEVYAQKDGAKSKTKTSANSTIAKTEPQPADRPEQVMSRIIFSQNFPVKCGSGRLNFLAKNTKATIVGGQFWCA